jgi:hypothetical protein
MRARFESHTPAPTGTPAGALSCALDEPGLRRQRERYAQLAPSVVHVRRAAQELLVEFAPGFDRATLAALIAVERECCPFFALDFDEGARRLRVGVGHPRAAAALDALLDELSPAVAKARSRGARVG